MDCDDFDQRGGLIKGQLTVNPLLHFFSLVIAAKDSWRMRVTN
jgi:hypothetical protein